jgi:hypothetical protein
VKKLLLLLILGCSGLAHATAYFVRATGDWTSTNTWSTVSCVGAAAAGVPTTGDTFTTCTGNTVTASTTVNIGTSGATGTTAITAQSTGGITVSSTGTLNLKGDINWTAGAITINGNLVFVTPAGSQYKINTTANTATMTFSCVGSSGTHATITTTGLGSNGWIQIGAVTAKPANLILTYCDISKLGDSTSGNSIGGGNCTSGFGCTTLHIDHTLLLNSGLFEFNFASDGSETLSVDSLSIVASNVTFALRIDDRVAKTSGTRTLSNITAYDGSGTSKIARLWVQDATCGTATGSNPKTVTVPCFYGYNYELSLTGAKNTVLEGVYLTQDVVPSGSALIVPDSQLNLVIENSATYGHTSNLHIYQEQGTDGGTTANKFWYNIIDGDSFFSSDTADICLPFLAITCSYNISLNNSGTLWTTLGTGNLVTADHNTLYNTVGGSVAENGFAATQMVSTQNNLVVKPFDLSGQGNAKEDLIHTGISTAGSYIRQTGWTVDYNAFFAMPGSGDSGAPPVNSGNGGNLVNSTLGVIGLVGFSQSPDTALDAKTATAGTTTTDVFCTTCDFVTNAKVGDYVLKTGAVGGGQFTSNCRIATISTATHVVCASAMAVVADTFSVRACYKTSAGACVNYGASGFGLHDVHLSADPFTTSANLAVSAWATSVGLTATPQGVGRALVTLNGCDYLGASTTPSAVASIGALNTYIRAAATPKANAGLGASASGDSTFIGALAPAVATGKPNLPLMGVGND